MKPEHAFAALAAVVAAPERPTRPEEASWVDFERQNGFAAPPDYRLLVEHYGVGSFGTSATAALGGWLYLLDPFDPQQSLVDQSSWERRNARGLQRCFPEQGPGWPIWAEAAGLLPWGGSIDGDLVGWWTTGAPSTWGTRFFGRSDDFEEFPLGIAEFIFRLLRGELGAPGLDGRLHPLDAGEAPQFVPMRIEARRPPEPPREDVTVRFAGLASAIDPASIPSSAEIFQAESAEDARLRSEEYWQRVGAATRPADEIVESWRSTAEPLGLQFRGFGLASEAGVPMHHVLSCSLEPAIEPVAKRLLLELSGRLDVAIADVRNLEHDRIWQDISGAPSTT
jgi:hypothetical protein